MKQLDPVQAFADRLAQERREKAARERRDIQKQDVAAEVGVSQSTYGRYEAGLTMPDDRTLYRIAAYFGVTPAWLRYGQAPRDGITDSAPIPNPQLRPATEADAQALDEQIHGKTAKKAANGRSTRRGG